MLWQRGAQASLSLPLLSSLYAAMAASQHLLVSFHFLSMKQEFPRWVRVEAQALLTTPSPFSLATRLLPKQSKPLWQSFLLLKATPNLNCKAPYSTTSLLFLLSNSLSRLWQSNMLVSLIVPLMRPHLSCSIISSIEALTGGYSWQTWPQLAPIQRSSVYIFDDRGYLGQLPMQNYCKCAMDSIRGMFSTVNHHSYHVDNKYFDANKSREQKDMKKLANSKSMTARGKETGKKETFIDSIQRRQAKLPGPSSYRIEAELSPKGSKKKLKYSPPPRQTIFDQMAKVEKKRSFPAANTYDPEAKMIDHHKSGLSKAANANYLEGAMGDHLWVPGVGQYNTAVRHAKEGKKGNKWVEGKSKRSKSLAMSKFPPVGTYSPTQQDTFDAIAVTKQSGKKSYFPREKRFQSSKEKAVPYYCIESEWGMNERLQKKDILSKISSSVAHHSIYH